MSKNEVLVQEETQTVMNIMDVELAMFGTFAQPLFLAVDIAEVIEYSPDKAHQMLDLVDDDEKLLDTVYRGGQQREMWFVTENGLYELLMQSRKPKAKLFKVHVKKLLKKIRMEAASRIGGNKAQLSIENAKLIFTNFSGIESQFNRAGDRNFHVIIKTQEEADVLAADGWNIKTLKSRDEDGEDGYSLPVSVSFKNTPPKVILITGKNQTTLTEETIGNLDSIDIEHVDLIVTPYHWDVNGNTGVKAYLKAMYVTMAEDIFSAKYEMEEEPFR